MRRVSEGAHNKRMRGRLLGGLLLLVPLASGCASASANSKPADRPAMNVPAPPPRVIEPTPEPAPEPVNDLPSAPAANSSTSRPPRPPTAKPEAKAEPPAEVSPKPEAPKSAEAKADAPQLRTPETADTSGAARNVQATVERANTMLSGVDYGPLSNNRKKAYNDAKRFIRQAEDALKRGNFAFAQGVATKAETLARELSGK